MYIYQFYEENHAVCIFVKKFKEWFECVRPAIGKVNLNEVK